MPDFKSFLLHTDQQVRDFRQRYASFIGQKGASVADWINRLPVMQKVDYLKSVPERNIGPVIGLLCILILDGQISITFVDDARCIYRNPGSIEEWETWCESMSPKRRKKD